MRAAAMSALPIDALDSVRIHVHVVYWRAASVLFGRIGRSIEIEAGGSSHQVIPSTRIASDEHYRVQEWHCGSVQPHPTPLNPHHQHKPHNRVCIGRRRRWMMMTIG